MTEKFERQKAEAIERMKAMQLMPQAIRAFKKDCTPWCSQRFGALFTLDEEEQKAVDRFKEEYPDYLVYHCINNMTEFGRLVSILYVSSDEEEWGYDREVMKDNFVLCYVANLNDDWMSEFGTIGFRSIFGGIERTA